MCYYQQKEFIQLLLKCLYNLYCVLLGIRFLIALDQISVSIHKFGL